MALVHLAQHRPLMEGLGFDSLSRACFCTLVTGSTAQVEAYRGGKKFKYLSHIHVALFLFLSLPLLPPSTLEMGWGEENMEI